MSRELAIIATMILVCANAKAAAPEPLDYGRILVEQFGAADAALKPFEIEVGDPGATTRDIIYVTPGTFEKLLSSAKNLDNESGIFRFSFGGDGRHSGEEVRLDRGGLADLIATVSSMYRAEGSDPPPFVAALAKRSH